jgi:tripartite-type tricarboxylate transporter receptor subunit TctC
MPEVLCARIAADVREITTDADIARRLRAMGYIPRADPPVEFAALLVRERTRWTEVARMYGAKPPQ